MELLNPGFEELDEAGFAAGWSPWPELSPETAAVSVDATQARSGNHSMRLRHELATSYTRAQQVITVEPNQQYYFRVWIRGEQIDPSAESMGARMYIEGIGGRDYATERQTGSFEWRRLAVGPLNSGNGGKITVMCYLHKATGTAWYDDVEAIKATPEFEQQLLGERARERFRADLVEARAAAANDATALAALDALAGRVETASLPSELDARSGPPYFPLHAELFAVMAQVNARRLPDAGPLGVWGADAFAPLPVLGLVPEDAEGSARAVMGLNEREQAVINLCNLSDKALRVRPEVSGVGDAGAPRITLREAVHVQTKDGTLVADPLPRLQEGPFGPEMTLAPGLYRQLWLDIRSGGNAGLYEGHVILRSEGLPAVEAPLSVEVLGVSLPDPLPIITWNYSYQNEPLIRDRWEQARADLFEHHINAYCWPAYVLPWPRFDAAGALEPLDWTVFDKALAAHDNIEYLLLWPGFEWERNLKLQQDLEVGSERSEERFVAWFRAMIDGLHERGLGYERIAWYLADEPTTVARVNAVVAAGRAVRKADPRAMIVENPYGACPKALLEQMAPVVDIWCPELQWSLGELMPFFQENSQLLWSYMVLSKATPAFGRYRLGFWQCWHHGMTGLGHWAYADGGGSIWDPHDSQRVDYAMVYDGDPDELIPSRRWEAWREGVEDYSYMWLLRETAGEAAADLLEAGVAEMLDDPTPEGLSKLREEVLRRLANEG